MLLTSWVVLEEILDYLDVARDLFSLPQKVFVGLLAWGKAAAV
jgi:hypothetical protein